jgi:hypothetical protein
VACLRGHSSRQSKHLLLLTVESCGVISRRLYFHPPSNIASTYLSASARMQPIMLQATSREGWKQSRHKMILQDSAVGHGKGQYY